MNIRHFSFCVSLCVLLGASYAFAGGKHPKETPPELPENWVQKNDVFVRIANHHVSANSYKKNLDRIVITGFFGDGVGTTDNRLISLSDLYADWAKVDRQHPNKQVHDPDKKKLAKVSGIYLNGELLLVSGRHAWRASDAIPMSDTPPNKGRKTHTNYDTLASETRVDLATITNTECADGNLCDEHRCAMNPLGCGHLRCEECFPLEDPAACITCLANAIAKSTCPVEDKV